MVESSVPIGVSSDVEGPSPRNVAAETNAGCPRLFANPCKPGLRERKKQQTRSRIVEVALELCHAHGFEATTVEQIANAADVSPRTVNRYFDMKEDIVLGPIEDFGEAVAAALRELPATGNELRTVCEAFLQVIDQAAGTDQPVSFRQFQQMQQIIRDSPSVGTRVLDYADRKSTAVAGALAARLGDEPDSLQVRIIVGTYQMLCHVALEGGLHDLMITGDADTAVRASRAALLAAYDEFMRVCAGVPSAAQA